ncbi:hypothetical protein CISIN_1g033863mg [Citrus sinensis]|uniref:Uncharacterized protein n=1 Tax=Citrus sinensis TaxID=2711 RepID=A0A067E0Q4_CITSI|nr:hypothetical protein CISIN_1g033863mg [Citrus sinensis]
MKVLRNSIKMCKFHTSPMQLLYFCAYKINLKQKVGKRTSQNQFFGPLSSPKFELRWPAKQSCLKTTRPSPCGQPTKLTCPSIFWLMYHRTRQLAPKIKHNDIYYMYHQCI